MRHNRLGRVNPLVLLRAGTNRVALYLQPTHCTPMYLSFFHLTGN